MNYWCPIYTLIKNVFRLMQCRDTSIVEDHLQGGSCDNHTHMDLLATDSTTKVDEEQPRCT